MVVFRSTFMASLDIKIPWHSVDAERATGLVREFEREVGPMHVLHGKKVRAIAARQDCDDVLFAIEGAQTCAVVHLTWIMKTETNPNFPSTEVFPTIEEWHRSRMIPDYADFTS